MHTKLWDLNNSVKLGKRERNETKKCKAWKEKAMESTRKNEEDYT